jgi:hypothetical protein
MTDTAQQLVLDPWKIVPGDTVLDSRGGVVGVALVHPTTGGKGGSNIGVYVQQPSGECGMHYIQPGTPTTVVRA